MQTLSELLDTGRYKEASEQAQQRLAHNPGDGEALLILARVSLQAGQPDQAERLLGRASPHAPADEVVMVRAAIACQRLNWAAARDLYGSLVRQPRHPPAAWYGLGVARLSLGDFQGAYEAQLQALTLAPQQPSVHFELGRLLAVQGQRGSAARAFVRTLRLDPRDVRAYGALAQVALGRGKVRLARRVLEAGLRQVPGAVELQTLLKGLPVPAAPSPGPSQAEGPAAVYTQARELLDRKRNREALKLLRQASERGVRTVPLKLMEAEACAGLLPTDVPGAIQAYEDAMALDPQGWVVCSNFGLFLQEQGYRYVPRALEVLREAHRRAPTRPEPALNLALAYYKSDQRAESLTLAEQLEAALPLEHPLYPQARLLVETLRKP